MKESINLIKEKQMIDTKALQSVIEGYKSYFPEHWKDESFKWRAVKCFQDNWDIDAVNFSEMFDKATAETYNLLASGYNYPKGMILAFADADEESTREMFRDLFDESKDLAARIEAFITTSGDMRRKYDPGTWKNHYQNTNAVTTYLWLMYPDKYYIYKYEVAKAAAKELSADFIPKRNGSVENVIESFKVFDEICDVIKADSELCKMITDAITPDLYPDPQFKTATIDLNFYMVRYYIPSKSKEVNDGWILTDYTPGLSVDDWMNLINDSSVFSFNSLKIMKRLKDYGGQATCTELAEKYGETPNFYNGGSSSLAERVYYATNCALPPKRESGNSRWWPILYTGKDADKNTRGSFIWRLRDELSDALEQVDLSNVPLYASKDDNTEKNYWWLTANPKIWSMSDLEVGEEQDYTMYNENGNKRRIFQNFLDAKAGDLVIGYEGHPVKKIVAICRITQENNGEVLFFEKIENVVDPVTYQTLKSFPELQNMEYFRNPQGSLFKLTKDEYDFIMDLIREGNPLVQKESYPKYSKEDFLDDVYMSEDNYDTLKELLENKKNVILNGAPGVGKTFAAKRLAYSMMGEKDESRIEMVQFHQNYSYEDFVMGYRPDGDGFTLTEGVFYNFCQTASNNPDKDYFFIIDEINRGNLSKIFGELLMLIENDYRGTKLTLAYSGMKFFVPENLYIIGMMNTADRSIALIDYALRRRFSFFDMMPGFSSDGFRAYQKCLKNETFDALIDQIKELNRTIANDKSLGVGFQIGHSYFCGREESTCTDSWMRSVVEYDIIPMLREYWFDNQSEFQRWAGILRGVIND